MQTLTHSRFRLIATMAMSLITVGVQAVAQETIFENVTESAGLGGGEFVAWADYDGDGHTDLATSGKLFHNNGDGKFTAVEKFAASHGVWGDFDNDGKLDYYGAGGEGNLLRNLGDDKFEAVPIPANIHKMSRAAAWGDANNDGSIDLFVTNYEVWPTRAFPDVLYMNKGDGTFAEPVSYPLKEEWRGRGVNWSDFDNDGDQDFYVSNYRLMPNHLWVNDGKGKFTEEAKERGVIGTDDGGAHPVQGATPSYQYSGHTIGSCFGDLNNDGHIDLVVVNFAHGPAFQDRTMVSINSGPPNYTFTNINEGNKAGIHYQESYAKGSLGDYDNDGDLDIFITTVYAHNNGTLFENDGTGKFTDVGDKAGVRGNDGYGVAWVDYDNDGDLDLSTSGILMRNRGNKNAWLKVKAVGDGKSNDAAIGARITVTAGDMSYVREVQAGNSGNQNPLVAHFGLGGHDGPVDLQVRFPSGKIVKQKANARTTTEIRESTSPD
jgi:hypothetical protein